MPGPGGWPPWGTTNRYYLLNATQSDKSPFFPDKDHQYCKAFTANLLPSTRRMLQVPTIAKA